MQQQPSTAHAKLFLKRQLCLWYLIHWGFPRPHSPSKRRDCNCPSPLGLLPHVNTLSCWAAFILYALCDLPPSYSSCLVSLSPIPSWPFRTGSLSPSPRCTLTSTGSRPTLLREQVGAHLNFNSTALAALWEIDLREQSGREITWEATAPVQARDDCSLGTEGTMVMD